MSPAAGAGLSGLTRFFISHTNVAEVSGAIHQLSTTACTSVLRLSYILYWSYCLVSHEHECQEIYAHRGPFKALKKKHVTVKMRRSFHSGLYNKHYCNRLLCLHWIIFKSNWTTGPTARGLRPFRNTLALSPELQPQRLEMRWCWMIPLEASACLQPLSLVNRKGLYTRVSRMSG